MAAILRQRLPVEVVSSKRAPSVSDSDSDSDAYATLDADLPTFTPPNFTIKEVLGAIPAECFERSAFKSSLYVVQDFLLIAAFMYAASHIDSSLGASGAVVNGFAGVAAKWAAWALYWAFAGFAFTGIWIIAHECGHQAYSTSKTINNSVGLVLHSLLLVPYHSWRISHSRHHAATGHMTRDEVFVPHTKSERASKPTGKRVKHNNIELEELVEDAPLYRLLHLIGQQLFGWPLYLIKNTSGQGHYPKWTNHFTPSSIIFDARHRQQVLLSDAGLAVVFAGLYFAVQKFGFATVFKYYGIPYLLTNSNLVHITYLQHTDPELPHYRAGEWNFVRGALCTMDRNFLGFVGPFFLHGICETHILHHVSSKIPHYNAWTATEALKNLLGEHYRYSDENIYVSLWKTAGTCKFVDDEGEVVFYRDAYGRAQYKPKEQVADSGVEVN